MCFAKATLFYGLWVTTAPLNFAAEAHQATRGPVLAIDLIIRRRRAGKLEVEGQGEGTTARELAEEVWEMVKQELLSVEIRQAEKETLDQFRCPECADDYLMSWGDALVNGEERGPPVEPTWSHWEDPHCDMCMCNAADSGLTFSRTGVQSEAVSNLLHDIVLQLASPHMWRTEDAHYLCDFDSLSAIALPARSAHEETTQVTAECDYDTLSSGSTTMRLAHGHFHVTTFAHLRFRRLIRDYRLQVVDRTKQTIVPLEHVNPTAEEGGSGIAVGSIVAMKEEEAKASRFAENEPRWMVWSFGDPCE